MKGKVSLHERHVRVLEPCFFVKSISIADVSNAESLEDAKRSEDSFFHSKKSFWRTMKIQEGADLVHPKEEKSFNNIEQQQ